MNLNKRDSSVSLSADRTAPFIADIYKWLGFQPLPAVCIKRSFSERLHNDGLLSDGLRLVIQNEQ
jgi:hypothetical protein